MKSINSSGYLWQRPTFFHQRCLICGGSASQEYTATHSTEPDPYVSWISLCYDHYQAISNLKFLLLNREEDLKAQLSIPTTSPLSEAISKADHV